MSHEEAGAGPRIALAGIMFETNSFAPGTTSMDAFSRSFAEGPELLEVGGGIDSIAGAAQVARTVGARLIPTTLATAMSGPTVAAGVYPELKRRLLSGLKPTLGQIDGIYLSLHGAMVTQDCDDVEGDLLQAIRSMVGPDLPIAYSADLHAHFTAKMAGATPLVAGYHTCPHVDIFETGQRAMTLLLAEIGGAHPVLKWRKIRMITSAEGQDNTVAPMSEIMARLADIVAEEGVLDAAVFATQPWLDVPELGWSALVITDGDPDRAQVLADELANMSWDRRHRVLAPKVDVNIALQAVHDAPEDGRPHIFSDGADSVSAGAAGDGVEILRALVETPPGGPSLVIVTDPAAVSECLRAGVGAQVTVDVGGALTPAFHRSLRVSGTVTTATDGRYQSLYPPNPADVGACVVLTIDKLIHLVITSRPASQLDYQLYLRMGLDPAKARVVVAKSAGGYRAYYEPIAAQCHDIDTTGPSDSRLERMPFTKIDRPLWPFDAELERPW